MRKQLDGILMEILDLIQEENKLSLLIMPSNVLPLHLKQTFPPKIGIFTEGEGDGFESGYLLKKILLKKYKIWIVID